MTSDPEWSPCSPGTLSSVAGQAQAESMRLTRRAALGIVAAVAAGGGLYLLRGEGPGGISCVHLRELAPDYVSGILDAESADRIDAHRRECAKCHSMLDQLEEQRAQQV